MTHDTLTSLRFVFGSLIACAVVYPLTLLVGAGLMPDRAQGSLIHDRHETIVGSRLIAQKFTRPEYLWPRPSAADYNGAAASGSNLGPSNPKLTERAVDSVAALGAVEASRIPADLIAASGSGLDPHITLAGALYQAPRIATARHMSQSRVEEVVRRTASSDSPWTPSLVNVLEANLALDRGLGMLVAPR